MLNLDKGEIRVQGVEGDVPAVGPTNVGVEPSGEIQIIAGEVPCRDGGLLVLMVIWFSESQKQFEKPSFGGF
jgi:hypothetical protein